MITNVDPIVRYQAMFAALDPDLPLALLPIRMETLFTPARHPDTLTVRFYPDVIHADAHAPELSAAEIDLGRAFWQRTWRAGPDPAAAQSAFDWLAGQVGPWRAAWVARQLTPKNQEDAPRRPVAEGLPLVPPPDFPKLAARTAPAVPTARLLPLRFAVVARNELHVEGTWFGAPVPEDLAMALSLSDADASDATALLRGQGLDWTHDVDAAVAVGMALRIDLTPAQARHGFDALVAFGIRAGDESQPLNSLLEAHRYTNGLDLIPVGEPTNVTDVARPTVHPAHSDLAALRTSELLTGDTAARPAIDADGDLYRAGASDALGLALGLAAGSALDRAEHAVAQHPAWAEGMNRVLWPALIGHYLDQVMDTVVDAEGRAWLRGFSTSFARGGGVLPPLLIGAQPYGVLPVSLIAEEESEPGTNVQQVEQVIATLIDVWRQSLASVAVLDADATDQAPEGTEGDLAATVSKVLGHLPNPAGLRVRPVEEMRAEYVDSYAGRMGGLKLLCLFLPDPQGNPYDPEDNPAVIRFEELEAELARGYLFQLSAFVDAAEMYASLSVDHGVVLTPAQLERYDEIAAYIREKLVPLVEAHRARTAPAISVFPFDQIPREHLDMGDPEAPEAFYSFHGAEGTEQDWALDLVAGDHSADAVSEVRSWLAELLDLASAGDPGPTETGPLPLLRRLAVISLDRAVGTDDLPDVVAGLRTLLELTDVAPDPVAELERLLREAIGVSSYRLDAWHTAVAAWRLENRRSKRPRGLQLGAYGLLTDVRPRAARSSQGFIAAPSIAQATTGAVVRAGWSALGGAEEAAALAVNLASERVRRGRWLIEGVRRGQDLRLLLGSRCERRLVEAGLPVWVEPLRGVALGAVGSSAAPTAIMDGLLVARAASDASDLDEIETECARLLAELLADPDRPPGDPSAVLTDLTADLDAVADLVTAQSVHDVTRGRTARATANLTAAAGGEVDLPAVTVPDTPREAVTITHQLILALPESGTGRGRARSDPGAPWPHRPWNAGCRASSGRRPRSRSR